MLRLTFGQFLCDTGIGCCWLEIMFLAENVAVFAWEDLRRYWLQQWIIIIIIIVITCEVSNVYYQEWTCWFRIYCSTHSLYRSYPTIYMCVCVCVSHSICSLSIGQSMILSSLHNNSSFYFSNLCLIFFTWFAHLNFVINEICLSFIVYWCN